MEKRTHIKFDHESDIWHIVQKWALENRYKERESFTNGKLYQKGTGFLVAPMMLKIEQIGSSVSLEAWVRANIFVRAMSLFILPSEMEIGPGGFRGAAPRSIARKAVNKLLVLLGQREIS